MVLNDSAKTMTIGDKKAIDAATVFEAADLEDAETS